MKKITLREWAEKNYSFPISQSTLLNYAQTKQITPPPKKVAGRWCCEETAKFIGISVADDQSTTDPLVRKILYGKTANSQP